jgi:hypothetical protein
VKKRREEKKKPVNRTVITEVLPVKTATGVEYIIVRTINGVSKVKVINGRKYYSNASQAYKVANTLV